MAKCEQKSLQGQETEGWPKVRDRVEAPDGDQPRVLCNAWAGEEAKAAFNWPHPGRALALYTDTPSQMTPTSHLDGLCLCRVDRATGSHLQGEKGSF